MFSGLTLTQCPLTFWTPVLGLQQLESWSPCTRWGAATSCGRNYSQGCHNLLLSTIIHVYDARVTDNDGRASNFLSWEDFTPGTYKMHFSTGQYYKEKQTETFYPYAEVIVLSDLHSFTQSFCSLC